MEKEPRTDAGVRVRRGAVRVEIKQAGIRAVVPVTPDAEHPPARIIIGGQEKPPAHRADSPFWNYNSAALRIRKNGRK